MSILNLLDLILEIDHDITRHFELDYILFDTFFLAFYVALLVRRGRIAPLWAGLSCAPILCAIEGIIWTATGVREYALPTPWDSLSRLSGSRLVSTIPPGTSPYRTAAVYSA